MKTSKLIAAISSLEVIGRTRLPMPLAIRMAKARKALTDEQEAIDDAKKALIFRVSNGGRTIDSDHPRWGEYVEGFEDLMDANVEAPDVFVLHARELAEPDDDGNDHEYSWTSSFKKIAQDIESNTIFGMGELLEIRLHGSPTQDE